MNYEEMYEVAYAIGYHHTKMLQAANDAAVFVDKSAFDTLMDKIPKDWYRTAGERFNAGNKAAAEVTS